MTTVNIHDAKTQFSKLIARVQRGEEVVIAKAGKPVARLVPATSPALPRQPGSARGKLRVHGDFDAPLPEEIMAAFEGS
ncbi:MAG: type II toxin-antitoxin system Phd/YefM family antitoxin [Alphaproteobacteria bacterium]